MKQPSFYFIMPLILLFIGGCGNSHQPTDSITDSLLFGKWKMVEYADGSVNALDTISFYENGKMDYPFEAGEFTYRFITSDSLAIYNRDFGEQHFKILKLSNDSLILIDGEIVKYIRVTDEQYICQNYYSLNQIVKNIYT